MRCTTLWYSWSSLVVNSFLGCVDLSIKTKGDDNIPTTPSGSQTTCWGHAETGNIASLLTHHLPVELRHACRLRNLYPYDLHGFPHSEPWTSVTESDLQLFQHKIESSSRITSAPHHCFCFPLTDHKLFVYINDFSSPCVNHTCGLSKDKSLVLLFFSYYI